MIVRSLPRPIAFPALSRLSRAEANFRTAALRLWGAPGVRHASEAAASLLGMPLRVRPQRDTRGGCRLGGGPCFRLVAEDGREVLWVLDPALGSFLCDRVLGAEEVTLPERPTHFSDVHLGVLLFLVSRLLPEDGPWTVHGCRLVTPEDTVPAGTHSHVGSLEVGAAKGWAQLHVLETGLPWRTAGTRDRTLTATETHLPLGLSLRAGSSRFDAQALAGLAPGDRVFFDPCDVDTSRPLHGKGTLILAGSRHRWEVRLDSHQLRVADHQLEPAESRHTMSDPKEPTRDQALQLAADSDVVVHLELARFRLPLRDALALEPGEILKTGTPLAETVRLVAGDRIVAVGRLVDVEGEVAVEVIDRSLEAEPLLAVSLPEDARRPPARPSEA